MFVIRLLSRGGSPTGTLTWILLIVLAPYVGLALYYLFPRQVGMRRLRRRRRKMAWMDSTLAGLWRAGGAPGRRPTPKISLVRLLRRLDEDSVHPGNAVRILATGKKFFGEVGRAIDEAKEFVHFETYIFRADGSGWLCWIDSSRRRGGASRCAFSTTASGAGRSRGGTSGS